MFSWFRELAAADFGDIRRDERLVKIVEALSEKPDASIPEACGTAARAKAAYCFLDNDAVTADGILEPHIQRTVERAGQFSRVLAIQDTTEINLTDHQATEGLGYLGASECRGIVLHNMICVSDDGVPLGVLAQFPWTRDVSGLGKRAERNEKPIDQKESQRWLDGLAVVERRLAGVTPTVVIGDSESDIYELFAQPRSENIDLLVRVYHRNRIVDHPNRHLEDAVLASPPRAEIEIELPRGDDRKPRTARLTVRWCRLTVCEPANYLGLRAATPIGLWFLHVREENPPAGEKALEWLLATTLPIENLEGALQLLKWYALRWRIERFHYVLKSGCKIEDRCLRTVRRMENLIATLSLVAWRLLWLTYHARQNPTATCHAVFDKDETEVLHLAIHPRQPLPQQPPTYGQVLRAVAKLGGYLARRNDPQPGVKTVWRGLRRLEDLTRGYRLAKMKAAAGSHEDFG